MDTHQHEATTYRWMTAVIASALVLAIIIGGVFTVRERLIATAQAEAENHARERAALTDRIVALEQSLANVDTNAPDQEREVNLLLERLDTMSKRLESIEQKSDEPILERPQATAPAARANDPTLRLVLVALSGKSFRPELDAWATQHGENTSVHEALAPFASLGIPNEAALVRGLLQALGNRPAPAAVEDESWIGKVNAHLKGFISIRRARGDDAYADLRREATTEELSTLIRHVERLNDTARAPLEEWLTRANNRQRALDALNSLSHDVGQ